MEGAIESVYKMRDANLMKLIKSTPPVTKTPESFTEQVPEIKQRKPKETWHPEFTLISLHPPFKINDPSRHKNWGITVKYKDNEKKYRSKTVMFGRRQSKFYVDDGDEMSRLKRMALQKESTDLFSSSFWNANILDREKTVGEAYTRLLKALNLIQ